MKSTLWFNPYRRILLLTIRISNCLRMGHLYQYNNFHSVDKHGSRCSTKNCSSNTHLSCNFQAHPILTAQTTEVILSFVLSAVLCNTPVDVAGIVSKIGLNNGVYFCIYIIYIYIYIYCIIIEELSFLHCSYFKLYALCSNFQLMEYMAMDQCEPKYLAN